MPRMPTASKKIDVSKPSNQVPKSFGMFLFKKKKERGLRFKL